MTITMFISILTIGAAATSLLTEAIKKFYENTKKQCSPNVIALINAIVIGGLGTAAAYMLTGVPWTVNNIICLILMIVVIWIGAMIGFDKISQLVRQISEIKWKKIEEE